MRFVAALSASVLAVGFGAIVAPPASAHTPDISASCDGVHVGATAYDPNLANRWSVTIDGVTQTGTFGVSVDQTFPVPQDGATTTWSAFVEAADGSYHQDRSGVVGPCGTPPDTQRAEAQHLSDCAVTFGGTTYGAGDLTYDEQYTDTYVWNAQSGTWDLVPGTEPTIANVVFTPWTTEQQVENGCIEESQGPPATHTGDASTHLDCDDDVQITTTVTTETPYVYDASTNSWVPGEPVKHTTTEETPVQPVDCVDHGGSPGATGPAPQVPTSVAAGARPLDASGLSGVSAQATATRDQGLPALLLCLLGVAALGLGAFRYQFPRDAGNGCASSVIT